MHLSFIDALIIKSMLVELHLPLNCDLTVVCYLTLRKWWMIRDGRGSELVNYRK